MIPPVFHVCHSEFNAITEDNFVSLAAFTVKATLIALVNSSLPLISDHQGLMIEELWKSTLKIVEIKEKGANFSVINGLH